LDCDFDFKSLQSDRIATAIAICQTVRAENRGDYLKSEDISSHDNHWPLTVNFHGACWLCGCCTWLDCRALVKDRQTERRMSLMFMYRLDGHVDLSERLIECQYELTDGLAYYLCTRRPG